MESISNAIEVYDFLNEFAVGQTLEIIAILEPLENQLCLVLDISGRRELGALDQSYRSEKRNR